MTNLADRSNWKSVITGTKTAFKKPDGTLYFQPIRYKIQSTELISVECDNSKAKPTWNFAGRCYVGNHLGYLFDEPLLLKKKKIIQIPEILTNQLITLEIIPAKWHQIFYFKIERYTGELKTKLESNIEEIKAILTETN